MHGTPFQPSTEGAGTEVVLVLCTCPDEAVARKIARALVEERLAACANRVTGVASTYRWQEAIHDHAEVLLLVKTVRERFDALRERIVALHPYELPEVIAVDVAAGLPAYLAWVAEQSRA